MQSAVDFWVYLNIIRKRLWLIFLLVITTVAVTLAVTYTAKPVYRATARLQVLATDSGDVSLFGQTRTTSTVEQVQQAQSDFIRAMRSGFVAWQTVADLNLDIGAMDLLAGLSFAAEGDFIIVTVESDDPGRAEAIANTQINNALEYFRGVRATPSRVLQDFVSQLLASEQQNMLSAEKSLLDFKQRHNVDSIAQETRALQDLIRTLKIERERTLMEQQKMAIFAETYRAQEQRYDTAADEIKSLTEPEEEPVAPYTQKYYRDLARQQEATALDYEAKRDGYAKSLEIYDRMINERTTELQELLKLYSEHNALERELSRATNNYNFLRDKENEARLKQSQAERLGYIQITEPARKPDQPAPSKTPQLVAVAGAVSLFTGFVLAFLLEFLSSVRKVAQRHRTD